MLINLYDDDLRLSDALDIDVALDALGVLFDVSGSASRESILANPLDRLESDLWRSSLTFVFLDVHGPVFWLPGGWEDFRWGRHPVLRIVKMGKVGERTIARVQIVR